MSTNNLEYAFITRILQDQDFHSVEKLQITEDFLTIPEVREIFRYIKDTFHSPGSLGQVPGMDTVQGKFRGFYAAPSGSTVSILCNEIRTQKIKLDLMNLAGGLYQEAQLNPISALATLKAQVPRLSSISDVGQDLTMSAAYNILRDRYNTVKSSGGLIGIPYPWEPLNEVTQGMQSGQYIVIYGRPKSMKSWLAIQMASHAYIRARRRVLYYTREMEPEEVAGRMACAFSRVDYGKFEKGELQPEVEEQVFRILSELIQDEQAAGAAGLHQPFLTIISDRSMGNDGGGVSWLQAKIRETQPDIVFVDGFYLMKDDRTNRREVDWKVITNISRDLKLTGQQFRIPIVGVTQATRKAEHTSGEDTTEAAYADAIGQDCDLMLRVIKPHQKNPETGRQELILRAPAMRKAQFDGMILQGEPATSFDYLRPYMETDGNQAPPGSQGSSIGARRPQRARSPFSSVDPRIGPR